MARSVIAAAVADLVQRVPEAVGPWEDPPVGRPHVLPLLTAVVAVLFGLRHNLPDEVLAEIFGWSQATITRYHQILHPILRWVTRPEADQRAERAGRPGVPVDGFVALVGEREHYAGLFSGQRRPPRRDGVFICGIAQRRAGHLAPRGPGMGGELTSKQKAYNDSVNRLRAAVERAIAHLKNWKIPKTDYHRIMTDFPDVLRTVTALEIFRTAAPGSE